MPGVNYMVSTHMGPYFQQLDWLLEFAPWVGWHLRDITYPII